MNVHKKTFQYGPHSVTLETGRLARQADGAALVSMGDTVVLVTAVGRKEAAPGKEPPVRDLAAGRDLVGNGAPGSAVRDALGRAEQQDVGAVREHDEGDDLARGGRLQCGS